jgi:nuclear control of ATPase protein 2
VADQCFSRIDRLLANAEPSEFGVLYYRDYGLLLTETHVLQQIAKVILPKQVYREFEGDLDELCDVKTPFDRLKTIVERIRWGYGRYF